MTRRLVSAVIAIAMFLSIYLFFSRSSVLAEPYVPRRIEVTVTSQGAPAGSSVVTLRWERDKPDYVFQKLRQVNADGTLIWDTKTQSHSGGYSSFTETVPHYTNQVYRVGRGTEWQEARVYPPNENAHTNYSKNSDTCKGCHRTHYAAHPKLLSERIIYNLCISCHNGSGSKYNVLEGKVRIAGSTYADSPAGAFSAAATTSYHNVFLEETNFQLWAPGGQKMSLTCTDCHSAHVTRNSSSFRLLKYKTAGPVEAYTVIEGNEYKTVYINRMNDFCSECHAHYNYNNHTLGGGIRPYPRTHGTGTSQVTVTTYRHPTDIDIDLWLRRVDLNIALPLEMRGGGRYMTCKTCHYAHGTTVIGVQQSGEPDMVKYNKTGGVIPQTWSTMLKRQENMGICLECHLDIWYNAGVQLQ